MYAQRFRFEWYMLSPAHQEVKLKSVKLRTEGKEYIVKDGDIIEFIV